MLANASDINLVDSAFVGPVDATVGLTAGIGVMVNPTVRSNRPGLNYDIVMPPDSAATDESFAGIVVRNQFMRTNSNGEACYFFEDMANYARRDRAGARVWVQLAQGSTVFGGPVYWIVRDTKNAGLKIGAFSAAPITGTAGSAGTSEDTVLLTGARFLGTFTAGEAPCNNIALVELL